MSLQSKGGIGITKAKIRQNKRKMKELAKAPGAYTVKIPVPSFGEDEAIHVVARINHFACCGHYEKQYKGGVAVGRLVRAFVTDAGEVWARVIPFESDNVDSKVWRSIDDE
jgi:hypothetical protein